MRPTDLPVLEARLIELAECFGAKPITKNGLKVWLDALMEPSIDDVKNVLTDWPKRNSKMPAPADVLKACGDRKGAQLEQTSAKHRADWSRAALPAPPTDRTYAIAAEELPKIREILSDCAGEPVAGTFHHVAGNSALDPKLWAKVLKIGEECGDHLSLAQRQAWREALGPS